MRRFLAVEPASDDSATDGVAGRAAREEQHAGGERVGIVVGHREKMGSVSRVARATRGPSGLSGHFN